MKKILATGIIVTVLFTSASAQSPLTAAGERDIKKVIEAETDAYFREDSIALYKFYTDDAITQSAWNSPNGSYGRVKGAQAIRKNMGEAFRKYTIERPVSLERTEWFFRSLSPEWVWVNFIQKTVAKDGKTYTNLETRMIKKENGQWKLAVMYSFGDHAVVPE
jgi:ketosteroid isomerase-like protein